MPDTITQDPATTETETAPAKKAPPAKKARQATPRTDGAPKTAARVTYSDFDEFMAELIADAELIEDAIVRAHARRLPDTPQYAERELQLVAGYIARGQVVELMAAAGRYWDGNPADEEAAAAQLAEWQETLRTTCEAGGLEVRGGRFGAL